LLPNRLVTAFSMSAKSDQCTHRGLISNDVSAYVLCLLMALRYCYFGCCLKLHTYSSSSSIFATAARQLSSVFLQRRSSSSGASTGYLRHSFSFSKWQNLCPALGVFQEIRPILHHLSARARGKAHDCKQHSQHSSGHEQAVIQCVRVHNPVHARWSTPGRGSHARSSCPCTPYAPAP
jgi:hypothetical protein